VSTNSTRFEPPESAVVIEAKFVEYPLKFWHSFHFIVSQQFHELLEFVDSRDKV